jgi:nucleoside-diphosphate-sugar epimerase
VTDDAQDRTPALEGGLVALITGAAGMLGSALQRELRADDTSLPLRELRLLDLHPPHDPRDLPSGWSWTAADLRDRAALDAACVGVDVVFHAAALIDLGDHPPDLVRAINIGGTENMIAACRAAGVRALVHTSSEDAVYGGEPIAAGDERLPYPERFGSLYCETKARGEQLALGAHDPPTLRTCALRPVGIFGEGDPYHISGLLGAATLGVLPRMGDGAALFSHVYVGNVAQAQLLAARALLDEAEGAVEQVGGEVFFVTDSAPVNFFDFYEPLLGQLGVRLAPPWLALPYRPLRLLGAAVELGARAVSPFFRPRLSLSRFAVDLICRDFYFRGDKLAQRLGYQPRYDHDHAFAATVADFRARSARPHPRPVVI